MSSFQRSDFAMGEELCADGSNINYYERPWCDHLLYCRTAVCAAHVSIYQQTIPASLEANAAPPENDIAVYAIGSAGWYAGIVDSLVSRASKDSLTVVSYIGEH